MNHPLEEPHRAEEEGALRRFLQSGAPRRCVQPSRSAGQGRFPAQGCAVFSGKGLTWRPGVGPGCRQEEHEAEAAAEPERRHGQAGPRRPPLQGSCPAPRRWELFSLRPLCLPFPWSGGFIDSSTWLSPDRKRACVSGCDSPVNKEDPALGRQTNTPHTRSCKSAHPGCRAPPRRTEGAHLA